MWRNWNFHTCKIVQQLWRMVCQFLKKLNMEPYDPDISFLGKYTERIEELYLYTNLYPNVQSSLFIITKMWKQSECLSTDEWMNRMCYIHTMGCYSPMKRSSVRTHATTWVNFKTMLSRSSQFQKTIQCVIDCIYLKRATQATLQREREQICGYLGLEGERLLRGWWLEVWGFFLGQEKCF